MKYLLLFSATCLILSCAPPAPGPSENPNQIDLTIVQMNDVYELSPINDQGGLARVASLLRAEEAKNPNTLAVIAGDMLSPSAIGLAKVDGARINGAQMIAAMNTLGLDLITFGNHEFDLSEEDLLSRIKESEFTWFSPNVFDRDGNPLGGVPPYVVQTYKKNGNVLKVGWFSVTIDFVKKDYVRYNGDYIAVVREQVKILREQEKVDVVIGLTHLAYTDDVELAEQVDGIDMILGGHEHENLAFYRGPNLTPVFKADANARSVYIHRLQWDTETKQLSHNAELRLIDNSLPDDPETAAVVKEWTDKALQGFRDEGMVPEQVVATTPEDLDGRESEIRNTTTALTKLYAEALYNSDADADAGIFNSGSIRIDDVVLASTAITEYDILRILPFGGDGVLVELSGDMLIRTLDIGKSNKGSGGFLQWWMISHEDETWKIDGKAIDPGNRYKVVLSDFLLTGMESNLEFLKAEGNTDLKVLKESTGDVRSIMAAQMKKNFAE